MAQLLGVLEQGLIYAILALGVYITFKILDFPDMTVDSSFPLGAAVTALMISGGIHPLWTLPAALDPKTADIIMRLTDRIVKEKKLTTLMVTHNLRYALEYGDRLLMLHEGKVVLDRAGQEKQDTQLDEVLKLFNEISVECGN